MRQNARLCGSMTPYSRRTIRGQTPLNVCFSRILIPIPSQRRRAVLNYRGRLTKDLNKCTEVACEVDDERRDSFCREIVDLHDK